MQKHSVVHVIDSLHTGGAERVLVTIANLLFQHGHKVKVVTIVEKGSLSAHLLPGIEQVNLERGIKFSPITMRKLAKETKGFDVVHVHSFFNLKYLWLSKMFFGFSASVFYHEHFGFRAQMKPTFWQKRIIPKTTFIATSNQINQWAIAQLHMPQNKVFTLPNIVVKEAVETLPEKQGARTKLVLVSNFRSEKNIEFGITLLQHMNREGNAYHLTIIGKLYDRDYYTGLQILMGQTNTVSSITFAHDVNNVQQMLGQFDIGLHTSSSESGPLAVIEYLAQGLPFVAYDTGEVIATIKSELDDCIAYSFNVTEWKSKIEHLQPTANNTIKQQLQQVFEKHFSAEVYYNQCINIYSSGKQ